MIKSKEQFQKHVKVCERAEQLGCNCDRISLLISLEMADDRFNLRLDELLKADDFNFLHDIYGILNNIQKPEFGFFVPRFASERVVVNG